MASPGLVSENDDSQMNVKGRAHLANAFSQSAVDKKCKICGDRAVGYNFSVISCESCKAFFRRNAGKEKELSCPFESKCEINSFSRRFCQSCRLKKCFEVGMKKEWILMQGNRRCKKPRLTVIPEKADDINKLFEQFGEGDVTVPKEMLVELVRKSTASSRPARCQCKCTCGFYPPDTPLTAAPSLSNGTTTPTCSFAQSTSRPCTLPCGPSSSFAFADRPEAPCEENRSELTTFPACTARSIVAAQFTGMADEYIPSTASSGLKEVAHHDYVSTSASTNLNYLRARPLWRSSIVPPSNGFTSVDLDESYRAAYTANIASEVQRPDLIPQLGLDEQEKCLLQELIFASKILKEPLDLGLNQKAAGDLAIMDVVRITELALRRIIFMAKELSFFRVLSQEDQIALLKGSCTELMILRGVMVFNPSKDAWNHDVLQGPSEMEIRLDILKRCKESQHYDEHKRFLTTFSEKWRQNENVMLLLSAITLFCPDRSNLLDITTIRRNHQCYRELLRKYLRIMCTTAEADVAYDMLLMKLVELHQLNQSMLQIYYGLNINEMDPLSQELFDLAKHR